MTFAISGSAETPRGDFRRRLYEPRYPGGTHSACHPGQGCADRQTGTGKTASFTLLAISSSRGRAKACMPRSLIITPTRELAAQVAENFETYSAGQKLLAL